MLAISSLASLPLSPASDDYAELFRQSLSAADAYPPYVQPDFHSRKSRYEQPVRGWREQQSQDQQHPTAAEDAPPSFLETSEDGSSTDDSSSSYAPSAPTHHPPAREGVLRQLWRPRDLGAGKLRCV